MGFARRRLDRATAAVVVAVGIVMVILVPFQMGQGEVVQRLRLSRSCRSHKNPNEIPITGIIRTDNQYIFIERAGKVALGEEWSGVIETVMYTATVLGGRWYL